MASGQMAATQTTMEGKSSGQHPVSILLYNTDTGNDTVTLQIVSGAGNPDAGNARTVFQAVLGTGESALISGVSLGPTDVLQGAATNGAVVNYVTFSLISMPAVPFAVQTYDSNAALKQKSVLTTGLGTGANLVNTAISTVGAGTLTAAALVGGDVTRTGPTAAFTDTTATATLIIAGMSNAAVGNSWFVSIKNTTAFLQTLAGGTGVTLTGQTVIPPFSVGTFLLTYTAAATVTMVGVSMAPMTAFAEPIVQGTLTTVGAGTITAALIADTLLLRTGSTAAFIDTTDTGTAIAAAMPNIAIGQSFEFTYQNSTYAIATLTGGTGVNAGATFGTVGVGCWATYLFTLTAANTFSVVVVNGGANFGTLPPFKLSTGTTLTTFTAAEMTGAQFTTYTSTAVTPGSIATATAAAMLAAIPGAFVGMQWVWRVINNVATNSMTITADASVTISGKTTLVATPFAFMDWLITLTSATTATMQYIGGGVATTG